MVSLFLSLFKTEDADECAMFGQEVCKGGYCKDTTGSYECYCKTGQYYDPVKLECKGVCVCVCGEGVSAERKRVFVTETKFESSPLMNHVFLFV